MEYPILIDLKDRRILMIGAGNVAARKAKEIIRCGGALTVVAPLGKQEFEVWEEAKVLKWHRRNFLLEDLDGCEFVFVVTNSESVNQRVVEEALKRNLWVNSGDQNYQGNFTLPALHRQGDILITVSTSGKSPGVAKQIRGTLEEQFDENWQRYLELIEQARKEISNSGTSQEREVFWQKLLVPSMIKLVREGSFFEIEEKIRDAIKRFGR